MLEYQEQFEHMHALMMADNAMLSEHFFISSFMSGRKTELRPIIRLLKPQNLNQAFEEALLQEQSITKMLGTQHFAGKQQHFNNQNTLVADPWNWVKE